MDPENLTKPILHILHAELKRAQEDSAFKSECSVCQVGLLLMRRGDYGGSFKLLRIDQCIRCGQRYIYDDHAVGGEPLHPLRGGQA